MDLRNHIREVPDFPKPGINFKDITTLLQNPEAFEYCISKFSEHLSGLEFDCLAGIESRGFIFAGPLSYLLKKPFILIRKPGKLPADTIKESYNLEYGENTLEIHRDAIQKGQKVVVIDDLLATGGTVGASQNLIEKLGGEVASYAFVVELGFLKGRKNLKSQVISLVTY